MRENALSACDKPHCRAICDGVTPALNAARTALLVHSSECSLVLSLTPYLDFIDRSCVTALSQGMIVPHTLNLILYDQFSTL